MKLLVFGGTRFSGRAATTLALERGHEVTLFHRGSPGGGEFPEAEHVLGDRRLDLSPLAGRRFDAVLDFCGYFPRDLRASTTLLGDAGWYGFVSSISAYPDGTPAGTDEDGAVREPPAEPEPDTIGELYGELKVGCERVVTSAFGARAAIVRPGFIVGPNDPTDRFPSLLRGAAAGGVRVLPGPAEAPFQFVDARDLGAFLVRLAEGAVGGTFLGVHPRGTTTLGEVVGLAKGVAGASTSFYWADPAALGAATTDEDRETGFPMWAKGEDGFHEFDPARATAAGLVHRPVRDTVEDTLAWAATTDRTPMRPHGLDPAREEALLATLTA